MNKKLLFITAGLLSLSFVALSIAPLTAFAQATPTITSISPATATAGSTSRAITVNGTNFVSGATVKFGTTNLTTVFVSATQLTATIPTASLGVAGTNAVTVANPDGATSNAVNFTVTAALPDTGARAKTFELNGTALVEALFASALLFGAAFQLKRASAK